MSRLASDHLPRLGPPTERAASAPTPERGTTAVKRAILSGLLAISLLGLAPSPTLADFHVRAAMPVELEGDPIEPHRTAPLTPLHAPSGAAVVDGDPACDGASSGVRSFVPLRALFGILMRFSWLIA